MLRKELESIEIKLHENSQLTAVYHSVDCHLVGMVWRQLQAIAQNIVLVYTHGGLVCFC